MKKSLVRNIAILLTFALAFSSMSRLAVAEEITGESLADTLAEDDSEIYDVQLSVTYGQTGLQLDGESFEEVFEEYFGS